MLTIPQRVSVLLVYSWSLWMIQVFSIMIPYEKDVQIVSHRGAAGYIPEHSPQAHQTAIDLQTDYIELDICITKDFEMVVNHDIILEQTTNVASVYPDRKNRNKLIRNFIDTVLKPKTKPTITLKEQIDLMSVCFAVDKSLKLNRNIKINYL